MDMGGMGKSHSHKPACKISMLWNWYTVDTCFITNSWHVRSKGAFAGSCIGVFFLVVASQWLHRFCREYDLAIASRGLQNDKLYTSESSSLGKESVGGEMPVTRVNPLIHALSHGWMVRRTNHLTDVSATPAEQVIRSVLFTVEWGLSYIIMLLFMYYNGFIIICCILGALVGRFLFTFNEPLSCLGNRAGEESHEMDRKCCR